MFKDLKIFDILYLGNTETYNITEHTVKDVKTIGDSMLSIVFDSFDRIGFQLTVKDNTHICKRNEFIISKDRRLVENVLNNF